MKIAHVRDVANVGSTLVDGLNALGNQAELIQTQVAGARYPLPIKSLFLPKRLQEAVAINKYLRTNNFDVIHLHVAYMGWLGIMGKYPFFLHCHGIDLYRNLYHPLLRKITVKALRAAEKVFFSTPDLMAHAARIRPDAIFLPNPINTENFRPMRDGHENRSPRLLFISRLDAVKGPEVAFAAIEELKRRRPEAQVDAFDLGGEVERYRDRTDVNFIRPVSYAEMPALLNSYDIIIGQFKLGIVSMSELESMACGKPVVSYFSYPSFYDEPPPLYSTNDLTILVEYLTKLVDDPSLRREAGEMGREWVVRHHDYLTVARTLETEYAALAKI
jgi:glycosyltransferase involved in cell wall biosynthesis